MPGTYISPAETGLYYLQSRYYDPAIGRFLNADALTSTGQGLLGNNMFAYCNNDPVNYSDDTGNMGRSAIKGERAQLDEIGIGGAIPIPVDPEFWDWLDDQWEEIKRRMALSLSKSTKKSYRTEYERHHIAAKKAPNAIRAATILKEVLIRGVEDEANLVWVKTDVHRRLHTDLYYLVANKIIIIAFESANGNKQLQEANVRQALGFLETLIEGLNALSNIE